MTLEIRRASHLFSRERVDRVGSNPIGYKSANPFDPDSTSNQFGRYGSPSSPESLNNPYGVGSPFRSDSPSNSYGKGWRIEGGK